MKTTRLIGLEGTNPLGFLAALGVQEAFASESAQPQLWWSDDLTPHALVGGTFSYERIADQAVKVFTQWRRSPAMNPRQLDGKPMERGDELKLLPADIRTYLCRTSREQRPESGLATALVAEGSLDNNRKAKPTDLYFTAGQQKFLDAARKILEQVSREDVLMGLEGPWRYESRMPSLGWDIVNDRLYALRAYDPSNDKKRTNPGPEALAVLGLSLFPVFKGRDKTITQGCSGSWKSVRYAWPLWDKPASPNAVKSLLAHACSTTSDLNHSFRSWSIFRILASPIRRTEQGGYGSFGPPEVLWQP